MLTWKTGLQPANSSPCSQSLLASAELFTDLLQQYVCSCTLMALALGLILARKPYGVDPGFL